MPNFDAHYYGDIAQAAESYDDYSKGEKETQIGWVRKDDRVDIYSRDVAIVRKVLCHDEFELDWYETTRDGNIVRVSARDYEEAGHDGRRPVHAVRGTLPIGVLSVRGSPRQSTGSAAVISDTVYQSDDE